MTDGIRDKYANRLGDPAGEEVGESDQSEDASSQENRSVSEGNAWSDGNVKQDWKGWTVYLPDGLDGPFDDEFNRLQYELDRDIKKDRHYKPLMVALALDRLERMDSNEVSEFLERMERMELSIFEG